MLIFISNELLSPKMQKKYKLDLKFIAFGILEGALFKTSRNSKGKNNGFVVKNNVKRFRRNSVVYGALFLCENYDFYSYILDGLNDCFYSVLGLNHPFSIVHKEKTKVKVIHFETLKDLAYLQYKEGTEIEAIAYFGNINHPKIKSKVFDKNNSYRIKDGLFANQLKELFMEVKKGCETQL